MRGRGFESKGGMEMAEYEMTAVNENEFYGEGE
jgi:hypothetical protein